VNKNVAKASLAGDAKSAATNLSAQTASAKPPVSWPRGLARSIQRTGRSSAM